MEYESGINLRSLLTFVKKWIWVVLVSTIIGAIISVVATEVLVEDKYRSEAQLIVNQPTDQNTIQLSDLQIGSNLINTYRQIIMGHAVLDQVSSTLNRGVSVGELQGGLSVVQTENAQTFNIIATLDTPELAQNVVDTTIYVFSQTLTEIYENVPLNIYVISPATYQPNPISNDRAMRVIIGGFLGAILSLIIIIIIEALDNTIKDEKILQQLGLIKLGEMERLSDSEYKENLFVADSKKSRQGRRS